MRDAADTTTQHVGLLHGKVQRLAATEDHNAAAAAELREVRERFHSSALGQRLFPNG